MMSSYHKKTERHKRDKLLRMEATITDLINASAYGQMVSHTSFGHIYEKSHLSTGMTAGHTPFWAITNMRTSWRYQASPTSSPTSRRNHCLNEAQIQSFIRWIGKPSAQMKTSSLWTRQNIIVSESSKRIFPPRGVTNLDEIVKSSAATIFDELQAKAKWISSNHCPKHPLEC